MSSFTHKGFTTREPHSAALPCQRPLLSTIPFLLCCFLVQVFHFKKMLKKAGKIGIKEMKVKPSELKPYVESVQKALVRLPEVLEVKRQSLSS